VTPLRREILVRNQDIPQDFEEAELCQKLFLMFTLVHCHQ